MPFSDFQSKLQLWLKGDDLTGPSALDWAGNQLNGTMVGGATFTDYSTGKIFGAMSFDGVDGHCVIPHVNNNPLDIKGSAFAVSFWMKPATWPGDGTLTTVAAKQHNAPTNYPSWAVYAGFGGTINFGISAGGVAKFIGSPTILAAGTWYHIVCVYDGANLSLYVSTTSFNPTPATIAATGNLDGSTADTWIGSNPTFPAGRYYHGLVDDFRIHNKVLTPTDIAGLYAWTDNMPTPNPTSVTKFKNFGTVGSVHFGLSTYLTLAAVPSEWGDGTAPINDFAPDTNFSWAEWVRYSKRIGCKAVMLTSKHLEGFCLWNSATNPNYNVKQTDWASSRTAASPPQSSDLVTLFLSEARGQGLGVGLYFCVYDALQKTAAGGYNAKYRTAILGMLDEVMTQFGSLDFVLLDGWGYTWPPFLGPSFAPDAGGIPLAVIYNFVTDRQPNCLVGVNDHNLQWGDILIRENDGDSEPPPGITSKPAMFWRPINSQNNGAWFGHSDSPVEPVSPGNRLNAHRRNRMLRRNYVWAPNFSPGPTGALTSDFKALLSAIPAYSTGGLSDGLENYYKLNEASGNALNYVGQRDLTAAGAPGSIAGVLGSARSFNGTTQYFTIADDDQVAASGSAALSWSLWFKPTVVNTTQFLFAKDDASGNHREYALYVDSSGVLHFRASADGSALFILDGPTLSAGTTYHVVAVFDPASASHELKLYANGAAAVSASLSGGSLFRSTAPFTIGAVGAGLNPFTGWIQNFGYWKGRGLGPADVAQLYNSGKALTPPFPSLSAQSSLLLGVANGL